MMHTFGYFCILYRKRFSIYSDCTFLHNFKGLGLCSAKRILPKVWLLIFFICLCFPSFLWISKLKHPPKKQKTKYQRDVHKFKGEKIIFPNREKDRWKRKKIYLRVLRLRSWFVSMRSLNPWWTVRRSRECGDEAAAVTARVWIVKGLEWSQWRVETWDLRLGVERTKTSEIESEILI